MAENQVINTTPDNSVDEITIIKESSFTNINFSFTSAPEANKVKNMLTSLSSGIFGMPYQFPDIVDTPVTGTEFGRKYAQKIASVMPVMFITPGEPAFMSGYSDDEKKAMMELYDHPDSDMKVEDIVGNNASAPFYTFNSKFQKYTSYVNVMVRALGSFMGLSDEQYTASSYDKISRFNLNNILNSSFKGFFNASTSVAFFLDSDASVSESFGNSSGESMLSSKVNSLSDTARELEFVLGSAGAGSMYETMKSAVGDVTNVMGDVASSVGIGEGIIGKLSSGLTTIVSGGKMIFPEIWNSSDYSRNYSISMKLRSPDPDPLSILLNIYIPLCCITALVMPKQMSSDANSYVSPFLVRATYKSIFNCDLGLVTGVEISKGGEDKWNAAGLPTSVDVTMTIKDLYSTMMMSSGRKELMNNMAQLDYLALMAGIDMNKDWVARNIKLQALLFGNEIISTPSTVWQGFKSGANKTVSSFLNKALGADIRWSN